MDKRKVYISYNREKDSVNYHLLRASCDNEITFISDNSNIEDTNNQSYFAQILSLISNKLTGIEAFIILVSENTRNLNNRMLFEVNRALEKDVPIIAVNTNGLRYIDEYNCPPAIKDKFVLHIANNPKVLTKAIEVWPNYYKEHKNDAIAGPSYFDDTIYKSLGLE